MISSAAFDLKFLTGVCCRWCRNFQIGGTGVSIMVCPMAEPFRIYVGWDAREPEAYDVAEFTQAPRASIPLAVMPIKLDELRARGLYHRDQDPLASTEFTYSRFLTPALAGFRGWALFCDCDFLWLDDIAGLVEYTRVPKAVYCVQHDYRPTETTKMDGAAQTVYPRKNWSSLMLFNCEHPAVAESHARGRQPRERRLSASHAMGRQGRGHRCAAGRMELARRLEPEAGARHPEGRPFHTRRAVVRALAERRLWRALVRGSATRCCASGACEQRDGGRRHRGCCSIARRARAASRA